VGPARRVDVEDGLHERFLVYGPNLVLRYVLAWRRDAATANSAAVGVDDAGMGVLGSSPSLWPHRADH
jgi:hypothetical protein